MPSALAIILHVRKTVHFYNKDKLLPIRAAPKLTEKLMKVKYATQVFSHTVAAGICTYSCVGSLTPSGPGTAELLSRFDSLFDCINSSTLQSPKKLRRAISEKSSHIAFLEKSIKQIKDIKVLNGNKDVTTRIKSMKGWLVTLNAIISIWNELKTLHNFQFLFI